MSEYIYFDHAATTPMRAAARVAWTTVAQGQYGNPHSVHRSGQAARGLVESAREELARVLDADPVEVLFTGGGTESVNTAVKGLFWARNGGGASRPVILLPGGEHHATLDSVEWLAANAGAEPAVLPVDADGRILLDALESALAEHGDRVALLTLLWANNEVGTVNPVAAAAAIAGRYGVPVHADAIAAFGSVPVAFAGSGLAALSVSAHKVGGPVGAGALLLRRDAVIEPLLHGGGQQRTLRSGTIDAAAAAAFAAAAALSEIALRAPADADNGSVGSAARIALLRDRLIAGVRAAVPGAALRGAAPEATLPAVEVRGAGASGDHPARLPGNAHFTFPGVEGESLLYLLDAAGFAVSTGSACTAGVTEVSHVLLAMGLDAAEARGALRITLGGGNTAAEVDAFLAVLPELVARARAASASAS